MAVQEIPLKAATAQQFLCEINGTTYGLSFYYLDTDMGGWAFDLCDQNFEPLAAGLQLVTGADLLAQYEYLNFGFTLYCVTDGAPFIPPWWSNLGQTSHLYAEY
jgi:hypothetical protein